MPSLVDEQRAREFFAHYSREDLSVLQRVIGSLLVTEEVVPAGIAESEEALEE